MSESVSFIRDALSAYRLESKKIYTTLLLAEEVIAESLKRCPEKEGGTYSVSVKKQFGNVFVRISVEGESYDPVNSLNLGMLRAMSNSTGDVAISLVVARTEKLLDLKKYHAS